MHSMHTTMISQSDRLIQMKKIKITRWGLGIGGHDGLMEVRFTVNRGEVSVLS